MRDSAKFWVWAVLLALASVVFSFALACAVPLAAFATLSALYLRKGEGVALLAIVWLVNQVVGYGCLDYPRDASTFVWGLALLASAWVAFGAARGAIMVVDAPAARLAVGFVAAFIGYEGTLFLAQFPLGGQSDAYAASVVVEIAMTNALALIGLLAIHAVGARMGWAFNSSRAAPELPGAA